MAVYPDIKIWRGSQVVRHGSAKPLHAGSIPAHAFIILASGQNRHMRQTVPKLGFYPATASGYTVSEGPRRLKTEFSDGLEKICPGGSQAKT